MFLIGKHKRHKPALWVERAGQEEAKKNDPLTP